MIAIDASSGGHSVANATALQKVTDSEREEEQAGSGPPTF